MLIMPPLQKFSLLLFTMNTNLSGLTKGGKTERIYESKFTLKAVIFYCHLSLLFCANVWHVLITMNNVFDHSVENQKKNLTSHP